MAIQTRLTRLLGIEHPILSAPMAGIAGAALVKAVGDAGGLGLLGGGYGDAAWLDREIAAVGNSRFGVGFITWSLERQPGLLDQALAANPAAVMLSFGEESGFAPRVKQAGALLICQVQSVAQARRAADAGADVIIAQGTEAGGHGAVRSTLPLVPAVVDALPHLPVVAAGGIADGRGLAAALMLGAEGVLMGSRFYVSAEAMAHEGAKRRAVAGSGDATIRSSVIDVARSLAWPAQYAIRTLSNPFIAGWHGREAALRDQAEAEAAKYRAAAEAGDFETAAVIVGEATDLIADCPAAADIVGRIAADAEALLAGAADRIGR